MEKILYNRLLRPVLAVVMVVSLALGVASSAWPAARQSARIEVLAEAGMPYQAKAELTEMYFTTREYERDGSTFSMPAGRYQALRITLGSGEGHNWWCVAYPPMCIDAAVEGQAAMVEQEILELEQTPVYKPKMALVEWVESLREAWEQ